MESFVSHLESAIDGTVLPANTVQSLHQGRPIWVRYDLDRIRHHLNRTDLKSRIPSMWRYRELLPATNNTEIISLGEGMSPLLSCKRLGKHLGLEKLSIKDESQLPTGSFKSRGQSTAITMAKHFGIKRVAIPTAGNAGGAMAAYAARAGLEAYVFMPSDTPEINRIEAQLAGAKVFLVNGLINDCGAIIKQGMEIMGWFDLSTLKEPYRLEGKKTMGLELAEQLNWRLPDVIVYPTGGGTGLIGMWKAFKELLELEWLDKTELPRMVAVQSNGCCPIVNAYNEGKRFAELFENAQTIAAGLRVPVAVGDFMILDALKESQGCAIAVEETQITDWVKQANRLEGIAVGPESATCLAAIDRLRDENWIHPEEQVVVFNCGAVQKNLDAIKLRKTELNIEQDINWEAVKQSY